MQTHSGPIVASRDTLTVIDCAACGWAHLDPLPTAAELDAYYQRDFWQKDKAQWLARYEDQRDWIDATNGDYLAALAGHTNGKKFLDVGCGYGFLVSAAHDMGWDARGMEISLSAHTYAVRNARGTDIYYTSWEDATIAGGYAAISALWLMEHLPDPLAFLLWAEAHLIPGGALLLVIPNEFTWMQREAGRVAAVPGYWVAPTHINYWSVATFANLLGRAGFRVVDRLGTHAMEGYIMGGKDYTDDEALGAACHANVRARELAMNRGERLVAARARGQIGEGRDMVIVAKVCDE